MSVTLVVCFYNRPWYFEPFLKAYRNQDTSIPLIIWNNNHSLKSKVAAYASENITVMHSKENIGGFGRFYASQKAKTDYVIFVDDDWEIKRNFVTHLLKRAKTRTLCGLWGWNYNKAADGRTRVIKASAEYIGTCGMIIDKRIFNRDALYHEILNRPESTIPMKRDASARKLAMEDLWLSFYARHIGYEVSACGKLEAFARNMNRDKYGNLTQKTPGGTSQTWHLKPSFVKWARRYFKNK